MEDESNEMILADGWARERNLRIHVGLLKFQETETSGRRSSTLKDNPTTKGIVHRVQTSVMCSPKYRETAR